MLIVETDVRRERLDLIGEHDIVSSHVRDLGQPDVARGYEAMAEVDLMEP